MSNNHPAKYTDVIVPVLAEYAQGATSILDPFAGTGRIFWLHEYLPGVRIEGLEIEPDWETDPRTTIGDALNPPWGPNTFDAIVTSPTYGNRLADHYKAKDGSRRRSYRHSLGRDLHPNNSGRLQWGKKYRVFHVEAWGAILPLLTPGGVFVLNIADHIRNWKRQYVSRWHFETLCAMGLTPERGRKVVTPGLRDGENRELRIGYEYVMKFRKN